MCIFAPSFQIRYILPSMDIFPTQHSTLSAAALAPQLAKRYGFQHSTCKLLIRNVSDTYLLETERGKYIFKIYRDNHRKKAEIEAEVELLLLCREGGASVAYPLPDNAGVFLQPFQAAEGLRYGVLFTYAQGQVVSKMNDQQLALLGQEMAVFHLISSNIQQPLFRKPFTLETTLIQPLQNIRPAFENLPDAYQYLEETTETVLTQLQQLPLNTFAYGYCQYDFLTKNFHFEGNERLTFFDFDFAGLGHLINDITSLYVHFFLDIYSGRMPLEEAQRSFAVFLAAYRQLKPVSELELSAIRLFGFSWWMFYLGFQYESFDDWSNIFFNERFLNDRVGLMRKWMEVPMFV